MGITVPKMSLLRTNKKNESVKFPELLKSYLY